MFWDLEEIPKGAKIVGSKWVTQIDVKTTFLNGDLEENVYMKQPKGFFSWRGRNIWDAA